MTLRMLMPLGLIILSNTIYHICAKNLPQQSNPLAPVFICYLTAAVVSLALIPVFKGSVPLSQTFKGVNYLSLIIGVVVVGLELGWVLAYRAGWNISVGSLIANISLAVILLVVGLIFFREKVNWTQVLGIVLCLSGLFLVGRS